MAAILPLDFWLSTVNNSEDPHDSCIRAVRCAQRPRKSCLAPCFVHAGDDVDSTSTQKYISPTDPSRERAIAGSLPPFFTPTGPHCSASDATHETARMSKGVILCGLCGFLRALCDSRFCSCFIQRFPSLSTTTCPPPQLVHSRSPICTCTIPGAWRTVNRRQCIHSRRYRQRSAPCVTVRGGRA